MTAIRRHPWRFAMILLLVIALAVLIASLVYMNTHTPGEWLMQKRLELESDGTHTYELLAERDIGDGLTVVFYQENNWMYSYIWGAVVAGRGLWYTSPELGVTSAPGIPDEYPPKPAQHYSSTEYTWRGDDYVLDFGAITDPEIEAVYVDGEAETMIDTGNGRRLFYAVLPADGYTGEHNALPEGIDALNETY